VVRLTEQQVKIRQFVTKTFLEKGYSPTKNEIAEYVKVEPSNVESVLKSLAENKALVLHPHDSEVWIAHPFSGSPNSFWVQSLTSKKGWYSNCCWCAMGIAALAKEDVRLISRWGGEEETFSVDVINGRLSSSNFVVHMALPVARLWENVVHSCALMLPFKTEQDLIDWCQRHRVEKGSSISAEKCFELASKWYGTYLDKDWNRKSPEEAKTFFASIGLDLNFSEIK